MLLSTKLLTAVTLVLGLVVVPQVRADGPPTPPASPSVTAIFIEGMHCLMCAKKMSSKLVLVPGVANSQGDVATATMTVVPQPGASPSPRAMWEAIEQAGYKPVKMIGPAGLFVVKPQL